MIIAGAFMKLAVNYSFFLFIGRAKSSSDEHRAYHLRKFPLQF